MVTGDNKVTAEAIAKDVNIIENKDYSYNEADPSGVKRVFEGKEFALKTGGTTEEKVKKRMIVKVKNEENFNKMVENMDVLSRAKPEDK